MVQRLTLYRGPTTVCDVEEIANWLRERIEPEIEIRDRFLDVHGHEGLAERFAEARVLDPYDQATGNTMLGIVRYEERALENPERAGGVLYDGVQVQRALNDALPAEERDLSHLHVPVLDRALATWGDHDKRWHKRVNVLGQPAIISVPGLYEAPAKPEAYYKRTAAPRAFEWGYPAPRGARKRGRGRVFDRERSQNDGSAQRLRAERLPLPRNWGGLL